MKLRHPFWLAAPLLLLAGCHSTGKAPVTSPRPVTTISIPLNNLTPEGWQFPGRITANSQRLSVDWDGDAAELLSQLAHRRGLTLRMTGVRLPLPVTIHEQNITFETLLRLVQVQINWRASLVQTATSLEVTFLPPLKGVSS